MGNIILLGLTTQKNTTHLRFGFRVLGFKASGAGYLGSKVLRA